MWVDKSRKGNVDEEVVVMCYSHKDRRLEEEARRAAHEQEQRRRREELAKAESRESPANRDRELVRA